LNWHCSPQMSISEHQSSYILLGPEAVKRRHSSETVLPLMNVVTSK
jgi:hypothetical protein